MGSNFSQCYFIIFLSHLYTVFCTIYKYKIKIYKLKTAGAKHTFPH